MSTVVRILSSSTIQCLPSIESNVNHGDIIDLTPWDLQLLPFEYTKNGLLYNNPVDLDTRGNIILRLKHSLSSALAIFPPIAGRLQITKHNNNGSSNNDNDDNNNVNNNKNTISCSIVCNNAGALFVHATVENTRIADVLEPTYLPPIHHSFFPFDGVKNYQGTSLPLFAVQVTELLDGIFIAYSINHVVADGTSTWHFINSWAQITKSNNCLQISKHPSFQRWFPNDTHRPICFPFTLSNNNENENEKLQNNPPERVFHLTKEKIAELKAIANLEVAGKSKISSLQAVLTRLWRCVTRCKKLDPQEHDSFLVDIGVRPRLGSLLPKDYFGNAIVCCEVTMKVGELLEEGGFGKGAWEMNKMIALYSDHDKLKNLYESWSRTPSFIQGNYSNSLVTSNSPWFDIYGNDFGWGNPVGVRSGTANKKNGKITLFAGAEEGSLDLEVCLPFQILEAIGNDPEFMDFVSK